MSWAQYIVDQLKTYDVVFRVTCPTPSWNKSCASPDRTRFSIFSPWRVKKKGGVVAGQHVGGQRGAVLMPTSGVGNAINALASLAIPYHVPMPLFIGWRGDLGEFNATQVLMGQALRPILEALRIPYFVLTHPEDVPTLLDGGLKLTYAMEQPVAFLLSTQLAGWKDEK